MILSRELSPEKYAADRANILLAPRSSGAGKINLARYSSPDRTMLIPVFIVRQQLLVVLNASIWTLDAHAPLAILREVSPSAYSFLLRIKTLLVDLRAVVELICIKAVERF